MPDIYDQHRAAFANVSAYVICRTGADGKPERVATIAFKYPRDGVGRQFCYLHIFGGTMVRGYASGCGYDKHSASASTAAHKVDLSTYYPDARESAEALRNALLPDSGYHWDTRVRDAGFHVFQAV